MAEMPKDIVVFHCEKDHKVYYFYTVCILKN